MKRIVPLLLAVLLFVPLLTACATPIGQRATQGGVYGAALGAATGAVLTGSGKGAAAGALIGAGIGTAAGALIGRAEAKTVYTEPQPLPWLTGKSIQVTGRSGGWGYGLDVALPVLEDQLKRRGAIVVRNPGPQYYPRGQQESAATDFVAEFNAIERSGAVITDLQVFDRTRQLVVSGSHTVYYNGYGSGYTGDFRVEALRQAAKNVVWALH